MRPRRPPRTRIEIDGETITLAEYYHRSSSYQPRALLPGRPWRRVPSVYKTYRGRPKLALTQVHPDDGGAVLTINSRWRNEPPHLAPSSMTLEDLSVILLHGQGITDVLKFGAMTYDLRAAPSAGALYSVDVYVAVRNVDGLAPGLYHHSIKEHALVQITEGAVTQKLAKATGCPHLHEQAAATLVMTVMASRSGVKYRERVYRYLNMDTGHVAYNLGVGAVARGYAAPMIGRFDDAAVNGLLELDTEKETALLIMPLGKPPGAPSERPSAGSSPAPAPTEPLFSLVRPQPPDEEARYVRMIQEGTSQHVKKGEGSLRPHPGTVSTAGSSDAGFAEPTANATAPETVIDLPAPPEGDQLFPAIRRRRSVRDYSFDAMTQVELSSLCVAAAGDGTDREPFHLITAPLNLYVVVRDVEDIEPGVYLFNPAARSLRQIKQGDFSLQSKRANLNQDFCRTAQVVFFKTVTFDALGEPDGDRGYRYANIRAGLMGGALYLQATALGMGACGVGAFMDDQAAAILGTDPDIEPVLYVTAAGKT